jgi:hypothetical protein
MSWFDVDWIKFCAHLRSLNVRHFGMAEATGLQVKGVETTWYVLLPYSFSVALRFLENPGLLRHLNVVSRRW